MNHPVLRESTYSFTLTLHSSHTELHGGSLSHQAVLMRLCTNYFLCQEYSPHRSQCEKLSSKMFNQHLFQGFLENAKLSYITKYILDYSTVKNIYIYTYKHMTPLACQTHLQTLRSLGQG